MSTQEHGTTSKLLNAENILKPHILGWASFILTGTCFYRLPEQFFPICFETNCPIMTNLKLTLNICLSSKFKEVIWVLMMKKLKGLYWEMARVLCLRPIANGKTPLIDSPKWTKKGFFWSFISVAEEKLHWAVLRTNGGCYFWAFYHGTVSSPIKCKKKTPWFIQPPSVCSTCLLDLCSRYRPNNHPGCTISETLRT